MLEYDRAKKSSWLTDWSNKKRGWMVLVLEKFKFKIFKNSLKNKINWSTKNDRLYSLTIEISLDIC